MSLNFDEFSRGLCELIADLIAKDILLFQCSIQFIREFANDLFKSMK